MSVVTLFQCPLPRRRWILMVGIMMPWSVRVVWSGPISLCWCGSNFWKFILICLKACQSQASGTLRTHSFDLCRAIPWAAGSWIMLYSARLLTSHWGLAAWEICKDSSCLSARGWSLEAWTWAGSGIPGRFQPAHDEDKRCPFSEPNSRLCFVENNWIFQSLTSNSQLVGGEAISGKYRLDNLGLLTAVYSIKRLVALFST